jgi:type II secretory pathway pseudopilin PulG
MLIVGLLATVAIPRFSSVPDEGRAATIVSDLRNLAVQQELHYSEHFHYGARGGDPSSAEASITCDREYGGMSWVRPSARGSSDPHFLPARRIQHDRTTVRPADHLQRDHG